MRGDHSRYSDVSCACVCLLKDKTGCFSVFSFIEPRATPKASLCVLACLKEKRRRRKNLKYCSFALHACDGAVI